MTIIVLTNLALSAAALTVLGLVMRLPVSLRHDRAEVRPTMRAEYQQAA